MPQHVLRSCKYVSIVSGQIRHLTFAVAEIAGIKIASTFKVLRYSPVFFFFFLVCISPYIPYIPYIPIYTIYMYKFRTPLAQTFRGYQPAADGTS